MAAVAPKAQDFTVIVLPDTQGYSQNWPQIFESQTQWVAENAQRLNIKMVLHMGDVCNRGAADEVQWQRAKKALDVIDAAGIPLFIAIGNHDGDDESKTRSTKVFNKYLGLQRYESKPWYGDVFTDGGAENVFGFVHAGGRDYLVLVLEFGPRKAVVEWANQVVAAHPKHDCIIITHNHIYFDNSLAGKDAAWNPHHYGLGTDSHDGVELWDALVRRHRNIVMIHSGHILGYGTGLRVDYGEQGNMVHQIMANYQMRKQDGEGYLRIMSFRPVAGTIEIKTYSPYLKTYLNDYRNEFILPFNPTEKQWQTKLVVGRVIDEFDGSPVVPTLVTAQKDGLIFGSTRSDMSGQFTLELPAGSYNITFDSEKHQWHTQTLNITSSSSDYAIVASLKPTVAPVAK